MWLTVRLQIIVEKEGKLLSISSQNYNHSDNKLAPINGKTVKIIKELQKPNTDIFSVLDKSNKSDSQKKIILPLTDNGQKQAYILIEYQEKS